MNKSRDSDREINKINKIQKLLQTIEGYDIGEEEAQQIV